MRKPRGKRAKHNKQSAAELSAKRHRSEEPGVNVCLPSRPPSLLLDLRYVNMLDATLEAIEVMSRRAEELGVDVKYPFTMLEHNAATVSYQNSTTPYSKLHGVYNLRDIWVLELKDSNVVKAEKDHTDLNVADLFTKWHDWHKMKKLLSFIG